MQYDVIIAGARVAGSTTAMLLARNGLRVLVVDRATFPSDTLSTHQLQVPGAARLRRWGLLDRLEAAGTPPTRQMTFANTMAEFTGSMPTVDGVDAMYSPRRTLLDAMLVEAAREAGAEVRESTIVEELIFDQGQPAGVRLRAKGGHSSDERAVMVVGADGKNSLVAKAVDAPVRRRHPARTLAFYTYWEGVDLAGANVRSRQDRVCGVFPTNDGRVISYLAWPARELATFQADHDRAVDTTLDTMGDLGARVKAGRRVEPIRATTDVPNVIRTPYGPGWALAGDAGLVMDPITGQGIGHALRDADLLSVALTAGLGGAANLEESLRGYARARDRETKSMYDLTVGLASFAAPTPGEAEMFQAIAASQEETDRFLSVMAGVLPSNRFFTSGHLIKLVGFKRFVQLARNRPRAA